MQNQQSITIKTDSEGRFCLNDPHKAARGNARDKPVHFFKLESTEALAIELLKGKDSYLYTPIKTTAGRTGGTFVVKELVYAYAMWISPQFHLKVIRAYDTLATQGVAVHSSAVADLQKNPLKYLKLLIVQAEEMVIELANYRNYGNYQRHPASDADCIVFCIALMNVPCPEFPYFVLPASSVLNLAHSGVGRMSACMLVT